MIWISLGICTIMGRTIASLIPGTAFTDYRQVQCNGTNYPGRTAWDVYNMPCSEVATALDQGAIASNPVNCASDTHAEFTTILGQGQHIADSLYWVEITIPGNNRVSISCTA